MADHDPRHLSDEIRAEWSNWANIVRLFASRREGRFKVVSEEYAALHRKLSHLIAQASASAPPQRQELFSGLRKSLAPWVTLESLNAADRSILANLDQRCADVQRLLERPVAAMARKVRLAVLIAGSVALIGILAGIFAFSTESSELLDLPLVIASWGRWTYLTIAEAGLHWKLVYLGGITALFGFVAVWFAARRY